MLLLSIISGFSLRILSLFDFFNKKIHIAAIIKQLIQITGLTANQAIHIVINHTIKVNHKAIIPVQIHMIFERKGITLANVSINLNIAANPQYININQINLKIRVIVLLACCACKNISSAVTFHCSSIEIFLQFETV